MNRPKLHFTPSKGWINDPNGLLWDGERYHLFAQHNPDDVVWGTMHWLHAVSSDMLHWKEIGIALAPDVLGTMFSGSAARLSDGKIALMYTAHGDMQRQCVAFSEDGVHFEKSPENPVIENPGLKDFRDPKLFRNRVYGCWSAILAAGDHIRFYRSEDLIHWSMTGTFASKRMGYIFECPDLFFLKTPEGREMAVMTCSMICTPEEKGCRMQYFIGEFDGDTFREIDPPSEPLRPDAGYDSYAGVTYSGTDETVWMHWMTATSHPMPVKDYCGCISLPRKLSLSRAKNGLRLSQKCVLPECAWHTLLADGTLPDAPFALRLTVNNAFELAFRDENQQDAFRIWLDSDGNICTERATSPDFVLGSAYNDDARRKTVVPRQSDGEMELLVVVDAYCTEIFADNGFYAHSLLTFPNGGFRSVKASEGTQIQGAIINLSRI